MAHKRTKEHPRGGEVYFGPDNIAYVKPDRSGNKGSGARPARTLEESFKVLAPYQPTDAEQKLIAWAQEQFDQIVAAEVHAVVHRSVKGFHIAQPKDVDLIYRKAKELGAGLPPRVL